MSSISQGWRSECLTSWIGSHWPECNWCSHGTNHLSGPNHGGNTNGTDAYPLDPPGAHDGSSGAGSAYECGGDDPSDDGDDEDVCERKALRRHRRMMRQPHMLLSSRLSQLARQSPDGNSSGGLVDVTSSLPRDGSPPMPTSPPDPGDLPPLPATGSSSVRTIKGTPAPAEAPAQTQKNKCTPSPTKSLVPSAST